MGEPTTTVDEWGVAAAQQLGLDLGGVDRHELITAVLDLTADIAHGVNRPAAPLTAFLVGPAGAPAHGPARGRPRQDRGGARPGRAVGAALTRLRLARLRTLARHLAPC